MINFFHSKLNRCIFAYSTKITKSKWKRLHTYTPTHIHTHAARTFIKYYAYMTQSVSQQSFFFTCLLAITQNAKQCIKTCVNKEMRLPKEKIYVLGAINKRKTQRKDDAGFSGSNFE